MAKLMILLSHSKEDARSFSSSSSVSHRSIWLFTFSFETFLTGFSLTHSHSLIAKLKA